MIKLNKLLSMEKYCKNIKNYKFGSSSNDEIINRISNLPVDLQEEILRILHELNAAEQERLYRRISSNLRKNRDNEKRRRFH